MNLKDAVLEIGCEEIPSSYIRPAMDQMVAAAQSSLKDHRIAYEHLYTYYTPRRLALYFKGLPEMQESETKEVTGPLVSVAFDEHGLPTRAGEGFARAQGVSAASLKRLMTPKGEVVVALRKTGGRLTSEILAEVFPEVIRKIRFPKVQRWGDGDFQFARPIRWILAVCSRTVIPFEVGGVRSNRHTFGLRALKQGPLDLDDATDYLEVLQKGGIVANPAERQQTIREKLQAEAARRGVKVIEDFELLKDVNNLVEAPEIIVGSFDPKYLELPAPVIITAMREHQKFFALSDSEGRLLPAFAAVINGRLKDDSVVVRSNEAVLKARLEDARFFYQEDLKIPLEKWGERTAGITWLEGLGTMADKAERLKKLTLKVAHLCGVKAGKDLVEAAGLCKADLATNIIREKEFNSLQGVMGSIYAAQQGHPDEVSVPLREHYLPRWSGDALPETPNGAILSIADKLDTICGCYKVRLIPSGSQDPFALRRQAAGLLQTLLKFRYPATLKALVSTALTQISGKADPKLVKEIVDFFESRLQTLLEGRNIPYDVVNACLVGPELPLTSFVEKSEKVAALKSQEDFQKLATAAGRVLRILPAKRPAGRVKKNLLRMPEERALWTAVAAARPSVQDAVRRGDTEALVSALMALVDPIHGFFEKVLVMDKAAAVRNNRLMLLSETADLLTGLCDFRKLVYASEASAAR